MVPLQAPIDDTFRFYEPAESHYMITLPQVIQSSPSLHICVSNPECKVDLVDKSNLILISGKTKEVLSVQQMTVFIFTDKYHHNLLGTIRVEVYARDVIYTRVKVGQTSTHTLSLPQMPTPRTVRLFSNKLIIKHGKTSIDGRQPELRTTPGSTTHVNV